MDSLSPLKYTGRNISSSVSMAFGEASYISPHSESRNNCSHGSCKTMGVRGQDSIAGTGVRLASPTTSTSDLSHAVY